MALLPNHFAVVRSAMADMSWQRPRTWQPREARQASVEKQQEKQNDRVQTKPTCTVAMRNARNSQATVRQPRGIPMNKTARSSLWCGTRWQNSWQHIWLFLLLLAAAPAPAYLPTTYGTCINFRSTVIFRNTTNLMCSRYLKQMCPILSTISDKVTLDHSFQIEVHEEFQIPCSLAL